jgi:putative transcriptional regulator
MIKNKLSELMGRKRIKMSEVADMTGLTRAAIGKIYHDQNKSISYDTVNKLCWALECEIQDIFEYIPD